MLDIFTARLKSLEQKKRARENRIKNLIISGTSSSSVAAAFSHIVLMGVIKKILNCIHIYV